MSTPVALGKPVRLNLQLDDGEESLPLIVKAVISDEFGNILANDIQLAHVGQGLFKDASFIMPDVPELIAQYFIYEADGVTLNSDYSIGVEAFHVVGGLNGSGSGSGTIFVGKEYIVEVDDDGQD